LWEETELNYGRDEEKLTGDETFCKKGQKSEKAIDRDKPPYL